ncbi:MAG: triose-phosphate isomerase [Candidatus Krumholzibacteriota bacterium]|nr:triose-phosphate isomerase [Candidatus Krumholzibacteriota bacterium]
MRRKLVAANWKMHKNVAEATAFATALRASSVPAHIDLLVIPPYLSLPAVCRALEGSDIAVGAQDLSWEQSGALTGEVSGAMIADVGASYVLVGHSERRHVLGESDDVVARKLGAALAAGLTPILCVGETLDAREAGDHESVVAAQIDSALAGGDAEDVARMVLAYEPVWAIGTGRTATADDAEEMHRFVRGRLEDSFGETVAGKTRIQYGGSVKPENAGELMDKSNVDGALVGGASLKAESFAAIVKAGVVAV